MEQQSCQTCRHWSEYTNNRIGNCDYISFGSVKDGDRAELVTEFISGDANAFVITTSDFSCSQYEGDDHDATSTR